MPDDSERRKNCAIGLKTLARENSRGAVRRNRAGRKSVSLAIVRVRGFDERRIPCLSWRRVEWAILSDCGQPVVTKCRGKAHAYPPFAFKTFSNPY